jgi:hypothetical protein
MDADHVSQVIETMTELNTPYLFLPLGEVIVNGLRRSYETPVQFRLAMYHTNSLRQILTNKRN